MKSANLFGSKIQKILLIASLAVIVFWVSTFFINVYRFALVGVFYEILWLPMLMLLFALPVLAVVFWVKERFKIRSLYLLIILMMVSLILTLIFLKK